MDVEKDDVENCLYFGTPLEDAQSCFLSRKQPLTNRAPRVWEQIVTDERGRRRLHGAFTGGFSAGYFNTVDTKVKQITHSSSSQNDCLGRFHPEDVQNLAQ